MQAWERLLHNDRNTISGLKYGSADVVNVSRQVDDHEIVERLVSPLQFHQLLRLKIGIEMQVIGLAGQEP